MHFDLITHDHDALLSIIAKKQPDNAGIEANDVERPQIAKRRAARSVAAAATKPQGSTADSHESREGRSRLTRGRQADDVKAATSAVGTTTRGASCVANKVIRSEAAPKASKVRQGKPSMARDIARPLYSSSCPPAVLLSIPRARRP